MGICPCRRCTTRVAERKCGAGATRLRPRACGACQATRRARSGWRGGVFSRRIIASCDMRFARDMEIETGVSTIPDRVPDGALPQAKLAWILSLPWSEKEEKGGKEEYEQKKLRAGAVRADRALTLSQSTLPCPNGKESTLYMFILPIFCRRSCTFFRILYSDCCGRFQAFRCVLQGLLLIPFLDALVVQVPLLGKQARDAPVRLAVKPRLRTISPAKHYY